MPIGHPFDGMQALIVDEQLREVEEGSDGELSLGYWQDDEKTRWAFVQVGGKNGTYYRRVMASVGPHRTNRSSIWDGLTIK
jgi:hypothetical protein